MTKTMMGGLIMDLAGTKPQLLFSGHLTNLFRFYAEA
jgi:hypothetical protein